MYKQLTALHGRWFVDRNAELDGYIDVDVWGLAALGFTLTTD